MEKISSILKETLDLVIECSKDQHPCEFAAALRAENGVITEIMPVPGSISGEEHAILPMHMLPPDRSICGVIHSHPIPDASWSDEDLHLFGKFGHLHIIIAYPYSRDSWKAYNQKGESVHLDVVDTHF